jgi:hypothetical protein
VDTLLVHAVWCTSFHDMHPASGVQHVHTPSTRRGATTASPLRTPTSLMPLHVDRVGAGMAGSVVTEDMMNTLQAIAAGCRLVSRGGSKELVVPKMLLEDAKLEVDKGRLKSKERFHGLLEVLLLAEGHPSVAIATSFLSLRLSCTTNKRWLRCLLLGQCFSMRCHVSLHILPMLLPDVALRQLMMSRDYESAVAATLVHLEQQFGACRLHAACS